LIITSRLFLFAGSAQLLAQLNAQEVALFRYLAFHDGNFLLNYMCKKLRITVWKVAILFVGVGTFKCIKCELVGLVGNWFCDGFIWIKLL